MILGIIAGGGTFPVMVAGNARTAGARIVGAGFSSDTDPSFPSHCDEFLWLKLGQLGRLIDFFRSRGVTHVVMAGPINKPRALDLRPDWRAARLLFSLKTRGDDALLRAVGRELEKEGMRLMAPHVFSPELHAPEGILSRRAPDERECRDIALGWTLADRLGDMDIGQCLVLKEGIVLAVEAIEGTDAAIRRGGRLGGPGAVVIKRPKRSQDKRLDLPAIGLETVQTMLEVKASCLAYEAGQVLFFDRAQALMLADANSMAVIGQAAPSSSP
jgi:DUF1009 family protein